MLYAVTVLVWGSTWIAIEYQLGVVAPEASIAYRYLLASALLFGWCLMTGRALRFDRGAHRYFLLLGLLLFSLNYVLTYYAQAYITSALTAVAFSTMLWLNLLNARIFFGARSGWPVVGGSILGVIGIAILFLPEVESFSMADMGFYGSGLAIAGALVASFGNMVSQAAQQRGLPIVQSNAWGMFYGGLMTALAVLLQGKSFSFDTSATYVASLLYLAVFGSIVGFGSYLTLLGRIGAGRAGYAMVMFPVVAVILSVMVGETTPDWRLALGVAFVLSGNLFVLRSRQQAPEKSTGASGRFVRYALEDRR
jgi:drug/metabolite transporter (DMT)-like permease